MYTSFPSADSVIVRDLFGVEDVPEVSTLGTSTECTPRVHPCTNELRMSKDVNHNRSLTVMAINSSKSKTGLLTVLQQDHDLRPSWNIYHLRWSGEEVAKQDTYRSTRVVDTNFLCIICNIELFSTALMRTARHYLILCKTGKDRRPVGCLDDNEGKKRLRLDLPGLARSGPGSLLPHFCRS